MRSVIILAIMALLLSPVFATNVEIHVQATSNDGSPQSVGISDGAYGTQDYQVFGPSASDYSGATAFDFDGAGNPAATSISLDITTLTSPTVLSLGDDELSGYIYLPFDVNMFNRPNNVIQVSSNGYMVLDYVYLSTSDSGCCQGELMSTQTVTGGSDFMVAGAWNDLNPSVSASPGGNISYGVEGSFPNRVFIVYFNNISNFGSTSGGYTFQIKLFENGTAANPTGSFCDGSVVGTPYSDFYSCAYSSSNGCFKCDLSKFGYSCTGNYGYGYNCPSEDNNDNHHESLDVGLDSSCEENVVTVSNGGNSAHVSVRDQADNELIASGETEGGSFSFPGCGMDVLVHATKSGASPSDTTYSLVSCEQCAPPPECTVDENCSVTEKCVQQQCVPVQCGQCEAVVNHACEALCASDEQCVDNQCKKPEQPQCTSDLQCKDNEFCDIPPGAAGGACKEVPPGDCGVVQNHAFVPYGYECGTEPGCRSCPEGKLCIDHVCVQNDVTCPSTGIVGDSKTCSATENGTACPNCDIEITTPDGKKSGGKTDDNGNFDLPLTVEGIYHVALLKNGSVIKTIDVQAFPQAQPQEPEKPTSTGGDAMSLLWLIVLLLLVVLGIVYWRSRGRKK
jgi:hypothetical protein